MSKILSRLDEDFIAIADPRYTARTLRVKQGSWAFDRIIQDLLETEFGSQIEKELAEL